MGVEEGPYNFLCDGSASGAILCELASTGVECLVAKRCTWETFLQLFLDPFDLWFSSVFIGRTKVGPDSATDDAALFLIASPNPVISQWGMGIRSYEAIAGCDLSGSGPCETALQNLAVAVRTDLERQFGAAEGDSLFNQYAELASLKNPDSNSGAIASRKLLDAKYTAAVDSGAIDPTTGFPPVSKPTPTCPQGQYYNVVQEKCIAVQVPPIPQCAPGYFYSLTQEKCVPVQQPPPPPTCPQGTSGIYPACVPTSHTGPLPIVPPRQGGCGCNPPGSLT